MQIKTILSLALLIASATVVSSQKNVVKETEKMMSFGSRPCFKIDFPNATPDIIEEEWKDWAKKHYNAKLKSGKSGEMSATGLKSKAFGPDEFSLYSKVEKSGEGSTLMVWYDLGSYFLNSRDNPSLTKETSRTLSQAYYEGRRATIGVEVKAQEDKLKEMEKKNKTLQTNNEKLQKSIEDYKAKIAKAEADLALNTKAQETSLTDMEAQKKLIEDTKMRVNNVENEGN